jgi:hypothetical protein
MDVTLFYETMIVQFLYVEMQSQHRIVVIMVIIHKAAETKF